MRLAIELLNKLVVQPCCHQAWPPKFHSAGWLIVIVGLVSGCLRQNSEPPLPQVLELSLTQNSIQLDPQRDSSGAAASITTNLFAGLMRVDPETGAAIPDLAAAPPDISADGLTYTFNLHPNLFWVGPEKTPVASLTTADVVFAIRRLCDNTTQPELAQPFSIIKNCGEANRADGTADLEAIGVRAIDAHIVEFTLIKPASYFPLLLTHWAARPLPRQWVIQGGQWSDPDQIVTSGPFLLDLFDPQRGVRLLRNSHFYAASSISLAEINLTFASEPNAPLAAFLHNLLDIAPVPAEFVAQVTRDPALKDQLQQQAGLCSKYLGFTTVKPPLDSREVRLALSQAVDRAGLVASLFPGQALPARFLTPPGIFGAPTSANVGVETDVTAARDLLARAGYPNGAGLPVLTLAYTTEGNNAQLAAALHLMWQESLGVTIRLLPLPPAVAPEALQNTVPLPQMPHIWLQHHCGAFPETLAWLSPTFGVNDSTNYARRVPTTFEELLLQAADAQDIEKRRELYAQAEQVLAVEEVVYSPLFHPVNYLMVKPWLTVNIYPFGGFEFRNWELNMAAKQAARATKPR
jgi:oligopeptide transport system substrate-binding protein